MVGAPLKGRIVIIDDVLTSAWPRSCRSTSWTIPTSVASGASWMIWMASRTALPDVRTSSMMTIRPLSGQGESGKSSVQEVEEDFGVPVEPIIGMNDIMVYLEEKGGMEKELNEMRKYRETYGIKA
jgi:orotate phosphoribosyltransferase